MINTVLWDPKSLLFYAVGDVGYVIQFLELTLSLWTVSDVVMICLHPSSLPFWYTSFPQYVLYVRQDKYMCACQTVTLLSVLKQTIKR